MRAVIALQNNGPQSSRNLNPLRREGFDYELVTLGKTLLIGPYAHPRQLKVGDVIKARGGNWQINRIERPATPHAYARVVCQPVRGPHFDRDPDDPNGDGAREESLL